MNIKFLSVLLVSLVISSLTQLPASADWKSQDGYIQPPLCKRKVDINSYLAALSLGKKLQFEVYELFNLVHMDECVLVDINYHGSQKSIIIYNGYIRWAEKDEVAMRSGTSYRFGRYIKYVYLK